MDDPFRNVHLSNGANSDFPSSSTSDQSAEEDGLLRTYARLLAAGEITWPEGLSPDETVRLEQMVREHRRQRLVAQITSRIAAEIAEDASEGG